MTSKFDNGSFNPDAENKTEKLKYDADSVIRGQTTDELVKSIQQEREKRLNSPPAESDIVFYIYPPLDEFSVEEINRFGIAAMSIRTLEEYVKEPLSSREKIDKMLAIKPELAPYLTIGKTIDQERINEAQEALDRAQVEGVRVIYHFFEMLSKELSDKNEVDPKLLPQNCAKVSVELGAFGKEGLQMEGVYIDTGDKSIHAIIDKMSKSNPDFNITTSIMPPDDNKPTDKWTFQINDTNLEKGRALISYSVYPPNKARVEQGQKGQDKKKE